MPIERRDWPGPGGDRTLWIYYEEAFEQLSDSLTCIYDCYDNNPTGPHHIGWVQPAPQPYRGNHEWVVDFCTVVELNKLSNEAMPEPYMSLTIETLGWSPHRPQALQDKLTRMANDAGVLTQYTNLDFIRRTAYIQHTKHLRHWSLEEIPKIGHTFFNPIVQNVGPWAWTMHVTVVQRLAAIIAWQREFAAYAGWAYLDDDSTVVQKQVPIEQIDFCHDAEDWQEIYHLWGRNPGEPPKLPWVKKPTPKTEKERLMDFFFGPRKKQ